MKPLPARDELVLAFVRDYTANYGAGPTQTAVVHHVRDQAVPEARASIEALKRAGLLRERFRTDLGVRIELPERGTSAARAYPARPCKAGCGPFIPTGPRSLYCHGLKCPGRAA